MKKLVKGVNVDAGIIMIADRSYFENLYPNRIIFPNSLVQLIKVKPGKYNLHWKIAKTWNGPISDSFLIEVISGEVVISDPCYIVPDVEWHSFLGIIDYGCNPAENTEIITSMGGDGT
mgnify:CR=1 FL=1